MLSYFSTTKNSLKYLKTYSNNLPIRQKCFGYLKKKSLGSLWSVIWPIMMYFPLLISPTIDLFLASGNWFRHCCKYRWNFSSLPKWKINFGFENIWRRKWWCFWNKRSEQDLISNFNINKIQNEFYSKSGRFGCQI